MRGITVLVDKRESYKQHDKYVFKCLLCDSLFNKEYRNKDSLHVCPSYRKNKTEKWCFKCISWKLIANFQKAKHVYGGYSKSCRTCRSVYMKKAEKKRIDKMRTEIMCLDRARRVISSAKHRAKRKGIPFNIDREYIYELFEQQEGKCYFSNLQMKRECKINIFSPSLDRLNPDEGYVRGNVAWVINGINSFKQTLNANDFLKMVKEIKWRNDGITGKS